MGQPNSMTQTTSIFRHSSRAQCTECAKLRVAKSWCLFVFCSASEWMVWYAGWHAGNKGPCFKIIWLILIHLGKYFISCISIYTCLQPGWLKYCRAFVPELVVLSYFALSWYLSLALSLSSNFIQIIIKVITDYRWPNSLK